MKCRIGKSIFTVNLPLKLFRATVAIADIGSLKSLHTFLKKTLYHMLEKFEQNRMVQTTHEIWNFLTKNKQTNKQTKTKTTTKKNGFLKPF